jgi:hypothetical protein
MQRRPWKQRWLTSFATAALLGVGASRRSHANPRPLPFTYPYETLPQGEAEIEQYVDTTPVRALSSSGDQVWLDIFRFQTEFEYGITDRLELGLYLQFVPSPNGALSSVPSFPDGNGIKQRLRLRLAEGDEWPVDVSLYAEIVEVDSEIELEAKINLQKRVGSARFMANLWGEREFYFDGRKDWVLNPTAGVTYEASPSVHPGVEYWMRAEFPDPKPPVEVFSNGPHHFVGPALMLSFGKVWWSSAVYWRASESKRTVQLGDNVGHVWARTVIGLSI